MNKFFTAFFTISSIAVAANAAISPTAEASFSKDASGCYLIGSAEDLYGFAQIVGTTAEDGNKTACGKLTTNVAVNAQVHNSEGELINKAENSTEVNAAFDPWTPMTGFRGIFDGQGYTISGLYTSLDEDAGFFSKVYGGAIIKDLNIRDSYFRATTRAGGIFADLQKMWEGDGYEEINAKFVVVESCSFGGSVTGGTGSSESTAGQNLGGLVGTVSPGMNLTIANSYNEGRVLAAKDAEVKAGTSTLHIGASDNYSKNATGMELVTGYHIGGLVGNIQPGAIVNVLNCYNTGTVDDKTGTPISATIAYNNEQDAAAAKDNVNCLDGGKNCTDGLSEQNLLDAFNNYNKKKVLAYYDASALNTLFGFVGVTFSTNDNKLIATLVDTEGSLVIPYDVAVDSVEFTRVFSAGVSSTIMLPFEISASNVSGAAFHKPLNMVTDGETGELSVGLSPAVTGTILDYQPYIVFSDADATIKFQGAVTLLASGSEDKSVSLGNGWSIIGTLNKRKWNESEHTDEIGKVYCYAANKTSTVDPGDFVKIGKNIFIRPMRAYLIYNEPQPNPKPRALAKMSAVSALDLPDRIKSIIVSPENLENSVESMEGSLENEQNDAMFVRTPSARVQGIVKNRWIDIKGRSLNRKPNAHGVFVNGNQAVVVK